MINADKMILPTYEQKEKARELRHKIIDEIMEIYDLKSLEVIHRFSSMYERQEYADHVLNLDEAINMMEIEDVRVLYKLCKDKAGSLIANGQITKICGDVIKQYDEWEEEENAGQEDNE